MLWTPPASRQPRELAGEVGRQLRALGARQWQIELTGPTIVAAIIAADNAPAQTPDPPAAIPTDSD